MGAMRNDLNRCTFMYSDDRRCLNLIHTPGSPLCYYHAFPRQKRKAAPPDQAAARAFYEWLSVHPLDSATHVNQALNQVFLLLVGRRISLRRAEALVRAARLQMKSVRDVHNEFTNDYFRRHWPQGNRFLKDVQALLATAVPQDPPPDPDPAAVLHPPSPPVAPLEMSPPANRASAARQGASAEAPQVGQLLDTA